jgi:N-acetylglucosamine-6-phosphate deacetylase
MQHYLAHGVTSLLVSLSPSSWKESLEVLRRVSGFIRRRLGGGIARGIHLEGPFLSASRPGALPARNFRPPSLRDAERLLEAGGGCVRTMTVAPELAGAHEVIRFLRRRRVVPAFGHSDADYVEAGRAVASGVHYATHLFNAMRGLHHRDPGAVTALLENPEVAVELIGDGHHVDIPVLGLVRRLKPPDKIVLVSDSAHPCGLADGVYRFAGGEVILRDGRVTRPDGTLAGSALTLDRAVAIQVKRAGTPLAEAVRYATRNAVQAARLSPQRGAIAPGKRADLVLLDRRLQVAATWLDGKLVYCRRPLRSG